MKISSFLENRRQRNRDIRQLLVSLQLRPRNWQYNIYHDDFMSKKLYNSIEKMTVWIGNDLWGLHFTIKDRYHGGAIFLSHHFSWKKKVYNVAMLALANQWVHCNEIQLT